MKFPVRAFCQSSRIAGSTALLVILAAPTAANAQTWGQNGVTIRQILDPSFVAQFIHPINNSGQVIGTSGNFAAVYESLTGTSQRVGDIGGARSVGYGINNTGGTVGISPPGAGSHAFLTQGSVTQDLGTLGGVRSLGYAVNDDGDVVGLASLADGRQHAFRFRDGTMEDLGTLGGTASQAYAINASGVAVGSSQYASGTLTHAFVTTSTGLKDLGTLGGATSIAYGINSGGTVVGYSFLAGSGFRHAFVSDGTSMSDLGTFGGAYSEAYGASDAGYLTGRAMGVDNVFRAAVWETGSAAYSAYALDDIANAQSGSTGWSFTFTEGISDDSRFVLAQGKNTISGTSGFYVLEAAPAVTPTPEPFSVTLLAIGLAGVVPIVRKRNARRVR